jgi:tRNA1(Val) A37 N6-methylase TrmN6
MRVTLAEIDPALTALAAQNAQRNAMADRVSALTLDATASAEAFAQAGLRQGDTDHVLMNPPFYDAARVQASPDAARRAAHLAQPNLFSAWVRTAAWLLRPGGVLTVIYHAGARDEVLAALVPEFGAARILPIYPKPGAAAIRIVVQAVRGVRGGVENCAGLQLNDGAGRPTREAETILREASPLVFVPAAPGP